MVFQGTNMILVCFLKNVLSEGLWKIWRNILGFLSNKDIFAPLITGHIAKAQQKNS